MATATASALLKLDDAHQVEQKHKEAVAVAVEACADDTKGQTCYICTQALHWKTKEGLVRMCACRGTAGFAHVSCLAEQAKILYAEAEENNLDAQAENDPWRLWSACGLCKQSYHGVVRCALGWACWKTYMDRPETDQARLSAMSELGSGLYHARHFAEALSVQEAELAMIRRIGGSENNILVVQANLAGTYERLGRDEEALQMERDVYSGMLNLFGQENERTLISASNYANGLLGLKRFGEAKALLLKTMPVARRVLGANNHITLTMRKIFAMALYKDDAAATLDDLREAENTLEETAGIARRVFGGAHPVTTGIEGTLQNARAALAARET